MLGNLHHQLFAVRGGNVDGFVNIRQIAGGKLYIYYGADDLRDGSSFIRHVSFNLSFAD
jgi:hypothetical protein